MKILLIRGAFLNQFESQNYEPLAKNHQIVGIGSLTSIHKKLAFPAKLFFSPYDLGRKIGQITQIGPTVERLTRGFFNRVLGDSHFLLGFEGWVNQKRFQSINQLKHWDIGHIAETYYGYDLQTAKLKSKGLIKKIVSTCWETIPFNNETIGKKKKIKEIVKKNIDLFICPTEKAKKALVIEGVDERKIRVIRVGVDLDKFKVKSEKLKVEKKDFVILFIGRLVEEKGVMDIYQVFKQVKSLKLKVKNYNLKLKIIGEGNLKNNLLNKIKKYKLENSVFIEKKSYEEIPRVYQEADILIVPSKSTKTWEEQYGMVLIEGMASGLPVVAYRSGAIPEVLGNGGLLVDEKDIEGLTKAVIDLINNKDLRVKLGKIGRRRVEKEFDREKIAKKIEGVYQELIR